MLVTIFALMVVGSILYTGWLLAGGMGAVLALILANVVGMAVVRQIHFTQQTKQ